MRVRLLVIVFLVSFNAVAEQESSIAYLIVDAYVPGESKQPKWIGIFGEKFSLHHPTGGWIAEVPATKIVIAHFDFHDDPRARHGSRIAKSRLEITPEPNKVYFLGMLKLQETHGFSNEYQIEIDGTLLLKACQERPELFSKFPVVFMYKPKKQSEMYISCSQQGT